MNVPLMQEFISGLHIGLLDRMSPNPLIRSLRHRALAGLAPLQPPVARDEEWRRTDPDHFNFQSYSLLPELSKRAPGAEDSWDQNFDVVVDVDESGFGIKDRTGVLQSGSCAVLPLEESAAQYPDILKRYFLGAASPSSPRYFNHLNATFWNIGFLIHVPTGARLTGGVLIRYRLSQRGALLMPRLIVVADAGSTINIVEQFTSPESADVLCIGGREFYAASDAQLNVVSVQEWGRHGCQLGEDWARIEAGGRVEWVTLALGGRLSKHMVGCDVCAPKAHAHLSGVFFADREQHFDQRTLQLHSAPDTTSYLLYKGAVKDRGRSVYQGVINAKPGAVRVDAYQMNNNLILSEGARADSLPGLEIDADDLKCSHGATSGTLDPEQLFYLQSRGLGESEARKLIVSGFFEEVIAKVPHQLVQDRLREQIASKMGPAE